MNEEMKRKIAELLGLDPNNVEFINMSDLNQPSLSVPKQQEIDYAVQRICKDTGMYYTGDTKKLYQDILETLQEVNTVVQNRVSDKQTPDELINTMVLIMLIEHFTSEMSEIAQHAIRQYLVKMNKQTNTKH